MDKGGDKQQQPQHTPKKRTNVLGAVGGKQQQQKRNQDDGKEKQQQLQVKRFRSNDNNNSNDDGPDELLLLDIRGNNNNSGQDNGKEKQQLKLFRNDGNNNTGPGDLLDIYGNKVDYIPPLKWSAPGVLAPARRMVDDDDDDNNNDQFADLFRPRGNVPKGKPQQQQKLQQKPAKSTNNSSMQIVKGKAVGSNNNTSGNSNINKFIINEELALMPAQQQQLSLLPSGLRSQLEKSLKEIAAAKIPDGLIVLLDRGMELDMQTGETHALVLLLPWKEGMIFGHLVGTVGSVEPLKETTKEDLLVSSVFLAFDAFMFQLHVHAWSSGAGAEELATLRTGQVVEFRHLRVQGQKPDANKQKGDFPYALLYNRTSTMRVLKDVAAGPRIQLLEEDEDNFGTEPGDLNMEQEEEAKVNIEEEEAENADEIQVIEQQQKPTSKNGKHKTGNVQQQQQQVSANPSVEMKRGNDQQQQQHQVTGQSGQQMKRDNGQQQQHQVAGHSGQLERDNGQQQQAHGEEEKDKDDDDDDDDEASHGVADAAEQIGHGRRPPVGEQQQLSSSSSVSPIHSSPQSDEEEEEEEAPRVDLLSTWERSRSRSRRTLCETLDVRFHEWARAGDEAVDCRMLQQAIGQLLQRAMAGREAPMLLGLALQPPGWGQPFHVPLRSPAQNTPAALAAALVRFFEDYEGLCLFDGSCRVKISAVWPLGTAADDGPIGACAPDEVAASAAAAGVSQCQSWIPVVNPDDTLCLARAICLGLADRRHRQLGRSNQQFRAWAQSQQGPAGAALAEELMQSARLPADKPHYGVPDAQRVQRFLDVRLGAQEVRLVLLDRERGFRVAWKAPAVAHFTLTLVCANRHWTYLQSPHQLFNARAWCPDCERPVDRRTHPAGCRAVCHLCFRFGVGFPCERSDGDGNGAPRRCDDCSFMFPNGDCFAAHLRRVDPPPPGWEHDQRRGQLHQSLCQQRQLCPHCVTAVWPSRQAPHHCAMAVAAPDAATLSSEDGDDDLPIEQQHGTGRAPKECAKCKGPHGPGMPCFVQPSRFPSQVQWAEQAAAAIDHPHMDDDEDEEEVEGQQQQQQRRQRRKRERKPLRFVFWDVESELVAGANDDDDAVAAAANDLHVQRWHKPLLVCAEVMCERCIADGVDMDREPARRAAGCFCGVPWRLGHARRPSCLLADAQLVVTQMPPDHRNPRRLAFHQFGNNNNNQRQQQQQQQSAIAQFADFLLHEGPRGVRTLLLAHNGGRYDIIFLLEELQRRGLQPKRLVATGLRIYQLQLGGQNQRELVFKDSLNFFGCPLSALPAMFGLTGVQDKPFFPYLFIRTANLHTVLDGLPAVEMYDPDGMKPPQRVSFLAWHAAEQQRRPFRWVLAEQLIDYCSNDCRLLRAAALRFRELVGAHAGGMEPFEAGSTIAGLALAVFRQCHLRPDRVVHSPEGGFLRGRRASAESRRFFWVLERVWSERRGRPVHIQTAQWSIGEAHVEDCGYRLDGLVRRPRPQRSLAIEYAGCFYHGCRLCYPDRQMVLAGGQTAEQLFQRTQQRAWELEHTHGLEVRQVWECKWKQQLARDRRLRQLAAQAKRELPGPLDLRRHALFGGRVEAFRLIFDAGPRDECVPLDIVSLYPYVMKYRPFPLGFPRVLTREALVLEEGHPEAICPPLPWLRADQNPFRGFLLCRVLPPHPSQLGGRKPLLPMRTQADRLVFGLCRQCAETCRQWPPCRHTSDQRSWIAAYSHFELNKALALHYRVLDLFEVWDYAEWSTPGPQSVVGEDGLFAVYVDDWLRLKAEATGWPDGCTTAEQRAAYVQEWEEREGIRLDPTRIQKNPGLRAVAKAMLVSLWGKLAQRADHDEVHFTRSAREFHDMLADCSRDVVDFTHLNEHLDRVQTRRRPPFVRAPQTNALQVACCVTSHARLHLWDYMEQIRLAGGEVLYCDTDSAIHVRRRGGPPCVPEGEWLGQMKREMVGRRIRSFVSGAAKNHALLSVDERSGGDRRAQMKVRSIQMTHEATQMLTYHRMRRLVERHFGGANQCRMGRHSHLRVPQRRFVRTKRAEIYTRAAYKIYKPMYTKGIVLGAADGYRILPFGWRDLPRGAVPAAAACPTSEEEEETLENSSNSIDDDDDDDETTSWSQEEFSTEEREDVAQEEEEEEENVDQLVGHSGWNQAQLRQHHFGI